MPKTIPTTDGAEMSDKPFSVKSCLLPGESVNPEALARIAESDEDTACSRAAKTMLNLLKSGTKSKNGNGPPKNAV